MEMGINEMINQCKMTIWDQDGHNWQRQQRTTCTSYAEAMCLISTCPCPSPSHQIHPYHPHNQLIGQTMKLTKIRQDKKQKQRTIKIDRKTNKNTIKHLLLGPLPIRFPYVQSNVEQSIVRLSVIWKEGWELMKSVKSQRRQSSSIKINQSI